MTSISSSGESHAGFKSGDLHQLVTDTIIKQLEAGTVPWQRPWRGADQPLLGLPLNAVKNTYYRGVNIVLLWGASLQKGFTSDEWATMQQWNSRKEYIRRGEQHSKIFFYEMKEKEVEGEIVKRPVLKYFRVFNRCQLQSYEALPAQPHLHDGTLLVEKVERIETFVDNTHAMVEHSGTDAFYNRTLDLISLPEPELFVSTDTCTATEGYYATLLHELIHWSGAPKRLNRTKGKKFGDTDYAAEELVAELGAAFLCAGFDITTADKGNHASYIDHWLQVLRNDKYFLMRAASQASKAVDYLKGIQPTCAPE